jgi:GAF domain-containing protein
MEEIETRYRNGFCQICGEISCTLNFDEALKSILESVHGCVDADASSILLLEPSHKTLSIGAARNLSNDYLERTPVDLKEDPVSAEVLREKVVTIEDMLEHPAYKELAQSEGLRSAIAAPLKSRGRPVGAIWVFTKERRKFTDEETSYLKTIAAQAGITLANARLHQNLHIISEVGRAVTSRLDLEHILDLIVENGIELFYGKGSSVFLTNPQENTLELKASHGLGDGFFEKEVLPIDDAVKECLEQMIVISDVSKEQASGFPENLTLEGVLSVVCTPLRVRDKSLGVLRLYMDHIRDFSQEDRMLLNILADFSAIAIQNARLYQHIKRDYEDLTRDVWNWYDWGERPPRI